MYVKQHIEEEQYGLNLAILSSKKELAGITQDEWNDQDVRKNINKMKNELQKLDVAKAFKSYALDKKIRVPDFLKSVQVVGKRDHFILNGTQDAGAGALGSRRAQPSPIKASKHITGM